MKHIDSIAHVRGESQYVSDLPRPEGMLYAAVFGSPVAHGRIRKLDISAAKALEGVVAVLTAADIPGDNQIGPLIPDELPLAEEEVHFIGQPVALVIADSPEIARKAAGMIILEHQALPVITDPREAYRKGEIIGNPRTFRLGDVEQAWGQCDVIVEGQCDLGGQEQLYLETQGCRAIPEEGGRMKLYSSTQSPYAVQRTAAKVLGLANHRVEVDVKRLGGGFGGKEDQATPWACLAALGAWKTGAPVELILSRHDDLKMTGKRHPYSSDFKIGLSKEGKILAYRVSHYQNAGASADLSPAILERTLFHSTNAYFIPNVEIFAVSCRTNLPPNTAFRGFGGPQGMFVIEAALAKAAEKMGLPREELQRKNLLREGDEFPYGQRAERVQIGTAWSILKEKYLPSIRQRVDQYNAAHRAVKKGYAVMPICFGISFTATFLNQGSALVHVYTDGSVSITTGGVEMGQGISTKIADIAARALGIREERIRVESTNTSRIANMSPSAASATADLCGGATLKAIDQILERLYAAARKELNLDKKAPCQIRDEQLLCNGKPTGWDWRKLVEATYFSRVSLSAHAFYATPGIHFDKSAEKGHPFAYHVYGAAIFEVTLDGLRGTYRIDSVKIVHDLARPLNRVIDLGQIEGGLAQGMGWMTVEDLQYDAQGRLLSNGLASYKAPEVYFMPDDLETTLLEDHENRFGPYGSKAVGEPPLMYGIGLFFAIREAMKAFRPGREYGFRVPMTPERVLLELYGDESQAAVVKNRFAATREV